MKNGNFLQLLFSLSFYILLASCGGGDKTPGVVLVTSTDEPVVSESGSTIQYFIGLDSEPDSAVNLIWNVSDESEGAFLNVDQSTTQSIELRFDQDNWLTPQVITVVGLDDKASDGNQTFDVASKVIDSEDNRYDNHASIILSVTNIDDDISAVTLSEADNIITNENGVIDTFGIVLNSKPSADVTIKVKSSNSNEGRFYLGDESATLDDEVEIKFEPNQWDVMQFISVVGQDDQVADGNQNYSLLILPVISEDDAYNGIDPPDINAINLDDDKAFVTILPNEIIELDEGGDAQKITVLLNTQPVDDVFLRLEVNDAESAFFSAEENLIDQSSFSSLQFTNDNWDSSQFLFISSSENNIANGPQNIQIITAVTSNDVHYHKIEVDEVEVAIYENDLAGILVQTEGANETSEDGGVSLLSVRLTSEPLEDVVIGFNSSNPTEGKLELQDSAVGANEEIEIKFTSENWMTTQIINVIGVDDGIVDGDQEYHVSYQVVSALTGDDAYKNTDIVPKGVVNFINRDTSKVVVDAKPEGSHLQPKIVDANEITSLHGAVSADDSYYEFINLEPFADYKITFSNSTHSLVYYSFDVKSCQGQEFDTITLTCIFTADWKGEINVQLGAWGAPTSYQLDISPYLQSGGEGTLAEPLTLTYAEGFVYEGYLQPGNNYYLVDGLSSGQFYKITLSDAADGTVMATFLDEDFSYVNKSCELGFAVYKFYGSCPTEASAEGKLWLRVTNYENGSDIKFEISPYTGVLSEGAIHSPIVVDDWQSDFSVFVSTASSYYHVKNLEPDTFYRIDVTESENSPHNSDSNFRFYNASVYATRDLFLVQDLCFQYQYDFCVVKTSVDGELDFVFDGVNSLYGAIYSVNITPISGVDSDGAIDSPVVLSAAADLPYSTNVGHLNSYYKITDLQPQTSYVVKFSNLQAGIYYLIHNEAGWNYFHVRHCLSYSGESELNCYVRSSKDGEIWIQGGLLDRSALLEPESFEINVSLYTGDPSEGLRPFPKLLDYKNDFPYSGTASPERSFYQVVNLSPDTEYVVTVLEASDEFNIATPHHNYDTFCNVNLQIGSNYCSLVSDSEGNARVEVFNSWSRYVGFNFKIKLEEYSGLLSEGVPTQPKSIPYSADEAYSGSVGLRNSYYQLTDLISNQKYFIKVSDISGTILLDAHGQTNCYKYGEINRDVSCLFVADENGNIDFYVKNIYSPTGATFTLTFSEFSPEIQGTINSPVVIDFGDVLPFKGSVAVGTSYYLITNLLPATSYKVSVGILEFSAQLDVFSNSAYSHQECGEGVHGGLLSCVATTNSEGKLWVSVSTTSEHTDIGGNYELNVEKFDGFPSQGSFDVPLSIDITSPYEGSASAANSYYLVSDLTPGEMYLVSIKEALDHLRLVTYQDDFNATQYCNKTGGVSSILYCLIAVDESGEIRIKVSGTAAEFPFLSGNEFEQGSSFILEAEKYTGLSAENIELNFAGSLTHNGSADILGSTYKIVDLQADAVYKISLSNTSSHTYFLASVDETDIRPCEVRISSNCYIATDQDAVLWINVVSADGENGSNFEMTIQQYEGYVSEGLEHSPKVLSYSEHLPHHGTVGPFASYYKIIGLDSNAKYVFEIIPEDTNFYMNVDTEIFSFDPSSPFSLGFNDWWYSPQLPQCNLSYESYFVVFPPLEQETKKCLVEASSSGELFLYANTSNERGVSYTINLVKFEGEASEGSKADPVVLDVDNHIPHEGTTNLSGSFYKIENLVAEQNYWITLSQQSEDLRIYVYSDAFISGKTLCDSSFLPGITGCSVAASAQGEIWIKVIHSDDNNTGLSYILDIYPAIEGSENSPIQVEFTELPLYSFAGENTNYFKIESLEPEVSYRLVIEFDSSLHDTYYFPFEPPIYFVSPYAMVSAFDDSLMTDNLCFLSNVHTIMFTCNVTSNLSGELWVAVTRLTSPGNLTFSMGLSKLQ